ncbi:transposase [Phenylobacterium sp. SCN 70-31]|uniref:transposase n=1 Tax=Phenylobacterium sp. SCN 70-31 TaxID=1660129 RepID=UPI000B203293|nr:transposase [Phenylobacterium sp. SCN 70-31]
MARPVRLEFGGALYHVTARGDRREAIYEDDVDRAQFLEVLGQVVGQFNWCCHAYCLMGNHYHLVIATPDGNLSKGMRQLNGVFTQWSNRRHHRTGHLFQGRYKAILVDADSYLLELTPAIKPLRGRWARQLGWRLMGFLRSLEHAVPGPWRRTRSSCTRGWKASRSGSI